MSQTTALETSTPNSAAGNLDYQARIKAPSLNLDSVKQGHTRLTVHRSIIDAPNGPQNVLS